MPKYKLSPEERAAEKERKENLRNIMKGLDVKSFDDLRDVFKLMVWEMLENGLEGELDDELGYTKYDYRNKEGENSRNGYSKKTLKTSFGETEIKVPRERDGEFEPQLVKKNQTTLTGDIEEKILSMYAKGMTTSDIETHIQDIYGFKNEIAKIENIDKAIKERKKAMLKNANLLDRILSEKELSHTNLCLLLEKIIIHEDEYGLRLEIRMKALFLEKSYTDEIGMICEDDYEEVSA